MQSSVFAVFPLIFLLVLKEFSSIFTSIFLWIIEDKGLLLMDILTFGLESSRSLNSSESMLRYTFLGVSAVLTVEEMEFFAEKGLDKGTLLV